MSNNMLLAICAGLVCFGVFTIAGSPGFFMQLLGAGMLGAGGAAASGAGDYHNWDRCAWNPGDCHNRVR